MDRISEHISLIEATKSVTAIRLGIANIPNVDTQVKMGKVAVSCFEPVRVYFGKPIGISSFFRTLELNVAVCGSASSQHVKGEAIDIDGDIFGGVRNADIYNYIKTHLEYDQLIWEFGTDVEPDWVHVSFREGCNRKKTLRSLKLQGVTKYVIM